MSFGVFLHPKAARFLKKAEPSLRRRIREDLVKLADSPEEEGERLMHSPFWRIRVGDYRVIYEIDREHSRVIVLAEIGWELHEDYWLRGEPIDSLEDVTLAILSASTFLCLTRRGCDT